MDKIKSDGGSSSYYTFYRDDGSPMETEEVIRCLVGNDFDLGNVIKASRRIHEEEKGTGKAGNDALYDWNKILYTAQKRINLLKGIDQDRNKKYIYRARGYVEHAESL